MATTAHTHASGIPMAGEGGDLWLMTTGEKAMTLYHRSITDPPGQVTAVSDLTGKLAGQGIAASSGQVWLVFDSDNAKGLTVQSRALRRTIRPGESRYGDPRFEPGLPPCSLVSLAVTSDGPWALVRVESAASLEKIDTATRPSTQAMDRAGRRSQREAEREAARRSGHESTDRTPPTTSPDESTDDTSPSITTQPGAINAMRLLRLDKGQWVIVPLPADLPVDAKAWLVTMKATDAAPALLHWRSSTNGENTEGGQTTASSESGVGELVSYRWSGNEEWSRRNHALASGPPFVPIAVEGQLVLARVAPSESGLRVNMSVAAESGEIELGPAMWLSDTSQAWGVASAGQAAAVVRAEPDRKMSIGAITLRGDSTPATPLAPPAREIFRESAGRIAQMILLGAGVAVMLLVMRREQSAPRPKLPEGMAPADLFRRSLAAGADMVPGVLAAMVFFRTGPDEVFAAWPAASVYMLTVPSTILALVVMVIHCSISEAMTGRSLGKYLLGLRLVSTTNQPIRTWQIIVRNLLKPVELIAWVMLFMPVILPLAQRFGDVLSRTMVLAPEPEDEEDDDQ